MMTYDQLVAFACDLELKVLATQKENQAMLHGELGQVSIVGVDKRVHLRTPIVSRQGWLMNDTGLFLHQ